MGWTSRPSRDRRTSGATMSLSDYKSRKEIAQIGPIPYSTLKKLDMRGEGPPTFRIGDRVYYHLPSFEAWLEAKLPSSDPSSPPQPRRGRRGRRTKKEKIEAERQTAVAEDRAQSGKTPAK